MKNLEIITLNKPNITDFALERNKLLTKSKAKWILFLDSDEKINNINFNLSDNFVGYEITRKNYFLGQYVGSDKIVRIGKKGSGKWRRAVHETWQINGKIGKIRNSYIIHNTADNLHGYIDKINYYSTLHALANKAEGKKSTLSKIIFFPTGKFLITLIKSRNAVFSIMQSLHSFLSWSKLYFLSS